MNNQQPVRRWRTLKELPGVPVGTEAMHFAAYPDPEAHPDWFEEVFPCRSPGCLTWRSLSEGGRTFSVCDDHWNDKKSPTIRSLWESVKPGGKYWTLHLDWMSDKEAEDYFTTLKHIQYRKIKFSGQEQWREE